MRSKFTLTFLPLLLSFVFAWVWFWPSREHIPGWGEDPSFNLWTFETVWNSLRHGAPLWEAPIFYPFPGALALSENQIIPALLSWPIRALCGNGAFTLNLLAVGMSLAAFGFTALWLQSLGVVSLALWGGLLFQGGGWAQEHYAHYQNICIFLFPLALWSWQRFLARPRASRAILAGLFFGWAVGWNVYFQIFLNLLLAGLALPQFLKNRKLRPQLFLLGGVAFAVQIPFVWHYLQIEKYLGSLSVSAGTFNDFSASPISWIAHGLGLNLLGQILPFYPAPRVEIEAVGFLGFATVALVFTSLRYKKSRPWALAALGFFWVSLGPRFGLHSLVQLFPGFSGLRGIGRIQSLVGLFSVAAVLLFLEKKSRRFQNVALAIILLELIPAHGPERVNVPAELGQGESPLETFIKPPQYPAASTPWLVVPHLTPQFQLLLAQTGISTFSGYSGRDPLNAQLLERLASVENRHQAVLEQLAFSGATRLLSVDPVTSLELKDFPELSFQGCYEHLGTRPCVFSRLIPEDPSPRIDLERDTYWEYQDTPTGIFATLRASSEGLLGYTLTGRCWMKETTQFPWFSWSRRRALSAFNFHGVRYLKNQAMMTEEAKQWIYRKHPGRLAWLQARKVYQIQCNRSGLTF